MGKNLLFLKFALVTFFCVFLQCQLYSQIDSLVIGKKYKITLYYGFEATGIVRSITDDTVKIETQYKTFSLPRKDISEINGKPIKSPVTDTANVEYKKEIVILYPPDPNESRLFLGPSGKTLKQGNFYISCASFFPWITIPLFFPFGAAGITDYLNLGVGASPYPPLFYIAPKIRPLHLEGIDVSVGLAYAQVYNFEDIDDDYNTGLMYIASTFEISKKYSLTIGTGLLYNIEWQFNNKFYTTGYPHLLLGFEAQTDKNFKLMTENWIDLGGERGANFSVFSIGGRYFKGSFALDFALLGVLTNFDVGGSSGKQYLIPMPWISAAYNFSL
jgi:hypothetical protein